MRTLFITLTIIFATISLRAQDIDTYYYSKDGKSVNKVFADYYRIVSLPTEASSDRIFRDFYMSGKLKGEGRYISIDPLNANNSVFDEECVFYREDGSVEKKFCMSGGVLNGTYVQFSSDGKEFIQIEYTNGKYSNDWYYKVNSKGAYGRFKHDTHEPVYDDFNPEAQFTTWIDGTPWLSYTIGGLTISMAVQKSNDYGKYHEVSIMIDNATFADMIIEPSVDITARGAFTPSRLVMYGEKREVFSYDAYMQRVQNRQAWAAVAMAASSAAAAVSSAFAPNSAFMYVNGHTAYINSYGNNISVYSPDLVFARVADAWISDRNIIQRGYLKKNTVSSGSIVSGYFNIKREDDGFLEVVYNYNGVKIPFYWNVSEQIAKPISPEALKTAPERPMKEYNTSNYKWKARHTGKIEGVWNTKKNNTKITLVDYNRILRGQSYVVVDVNGEHEVSNVREGSFEIVLTVDAVNVQFPFSIICKSNNDLNFLDVEKRQ